MVLRAVRELAVLLLQTTHDVLEFDIPEVMAVKGYGTSTLTVSQAVRALSNAFDRASAAYVVRQRDLPGAGKFPAS